jgi:hypothetical protein
MFDINGSLIVYLKTFMRSIRKINKAEDVRISKTTIASRHHFTPHLAITELGWAETGILPLTVRYSPELDSFAAFEKYPDIRHFLTVTWSSPHDAKGVPFSAKPRNIPHK